MCGDRRKNLVAGGCVVTDAKSVFDNLSKTGSLPVERPTLLDLLSEKEYVEDEVIEIRWVPSFHMLADPLTKVMRSGTFKEFVMTGRWSLVQTEEEQREEPHHAGLRKAQRQRQKERMKQPGPQAAK